MSQADSSSKKRIAVVGAGPGGLTSAMILAHRGFDVTVYEKEDQVGGRNGEIRLGDYRFDIGPTFLMMKFLLDQMFEETGRRSDDYLQFLQLEPMYELVFDDFSIFPTTDPPEMKRQIEAIYPGQGQGVDRFLDKEKNRFELMYPCLQKDYSHVSDMVKPVLLKALPHLSIGKSLYQVLGRYFEPEKLRLSFTFQSKYLGMSPWSCPAAFAILPYIEYAYGVFHVTGGLSQISQAMARVFEEEGGTLHLKTPVKRILVDDQRRARGVELETGDKVEADAVIVNADFAHAMTTLVDPQHVKKYTQENLLRRDYSCSTFMLYLGVDKTYETAHHTIVFASDYRKNLQDVAEGRLPEDISFYVRNASVNDDQIAPQGHSAIYVLVPMPNNKSGIDWEKETPSVREKTLDEIQRRTSMKDLREHIVEETMISPRQWETERSVFRGATFNLAHSLGQMLYFRPRNEFEEFSHCYLVGGGTHPGSGLPTIYESGRISANLISAKYGVPFRKPPTLENA